MHRPAGLVIAACAALLLLATPAWAHTALESSEPAHGTTVDGPLDAVVLTFNRPIDLAGDGVEILDRDGAVVASDAVVDGATVTVEMVEPLTSGRYGVRWAVRSSDNHPVRDVFEFKVAATPGVVAPPAAREGQRTVPPATREASPTTPRAARDAAPDASDATRRTAPAAAVNDDSVALSRALAADPTAPIRRLDQALRGVFYVVGLGAVGLLAFLVGVWDGPRREARRLTRLTSRMAGVAALIVVAQPIVRAARIAGGWDGALAAVPDTVSGLDAMGMGMRLTGAVLLMSGLAGLRRLLCTTAPPIAGGAVDVRTPSVPVVPPATPPAGRRMAAAPVAILGAAALVTSFALVGHAVSAEPRIVAAGAIVAHVTAAALWGGGLLGLVVTLSSRRRRPRHQRTGLLAARFSVLATAGVGVAGGAGIVLAAVRLDDVSELWTTPYGSALLAKVAVVAVIVGLGAYNHFVAVPRLRRDPEHPVAGHLRWLGLVELALLVAVAGLTSVLVGLAG